MRRGGLLVLIPLGLAACSSAWERQTQLVMNRRAAGDYEGALAAQRVLVDQANWLAPPEDRSAAAEADRLMDLAELLGRQHQIGAALDTYRDVLRMDPTRIEPVLVGIDLLPLPRERREAYMDEFVKNAITIDPHLDTPARTNRQCWSYNARAIRVRQVRTRTGTAGLEREVVYDAQPWVYEARAGNWHPDGDWISSAGAEIQRVDGPTNAYYRAVIDADGGFYADASVPPCHRDQWRGPYDTRRDSVYVTRELPRR